MSPDPCDLSLEEELADLAAIVLDGYRQKDTAGPDVVNLLREFHWRSSQEKATFWQSLPPGLQSWISREVKRSTTTGNTAAS